MFRGIYSAATGMEASMRHHEVLAHNLAHASAPGFRQRGVAFGSFEQALDDATGQPLQGAQTAQEYTEFTQGPLQQTGSPLDLALSGAGFFAIEGPQGPLYTRNGAFHRSSSGQLVNSEGLALQGMTGPIVIPPQASAFNVGSDGTVEADGNLVGRIRVVSFARPDQLLPAGTTLFTAPAEAGEQVAQVTVLQGFREGSNVDSAVAMVSLIQLQRYAEASQRTLQTLDRSLQLVTRPQ